MGKKAVYSNKGLQIYITGEDFEDLLDKSEISMPLFIGKAQTKKSFVWLIISVESYASLKSAFILERNAVDEVRAAAKQRRYISGRPLPKTNRS